MVEVLSGVPKVTVCMVMAILSVEEIPPIFCRARDPCRAKIACASGLRVTRPTSLFDKQVVGPTMSTDKQQQQNNFSKNRLYPRIL